MKNKSILALAILLLIPAIYSFSFGTVPKNGYQMVEKGGSGQFTILLWNLGESSYSIDIELKTELPDWDIIVRPQNFILEPTPVAEPPYADGEYMEIAGKGIVKVETLRIFVKTPDDVKPGKYELLLVAKAGNPEGQISVFQEREFRLIVEVEKEQTILEKTYGTLKLTGEKIGEQVEKIKSGISGMITTFNISPLTGFIIGLALILSGIALVLIKRK